MRILVYAPVFLPSVGGLELMTKMLAEAFVECGHQITVVTKTRDEGESRFEYRVVRSPSPMQLVRLVKAADVLLHMNLSLKGLWPLFFAWRPLVIGHFGSYRRLSGKRGLRDDLKYFISARATNIACSKSVRADLPPRTRVIGNAYEDQLFRIVLGERGKDLVFVGRLVSEKGVDILLTSLVLLSKRGVTPKLTIIGAGPAEQELRKYCQEMNLNDQVMFAGKLTGDELVALINRHKVMVIPSRNEGFGIVALEGIACGCVIVGSDAGGLPEAIGECGIAFKNGDVEDLAVKIVSALADNSVWEKVVASRDVHLARFTRRGVARQYLEVLEGVVAHTGAYKRLR